jgi:hypothetical protein
LCTCTSFHFFSTLQLSVKNTKVLMKESKSKFLLLFFQTVRKLDFHRGGYLSRAEFRSLWLNEKSPYKTKLADAKNKSLYKTVREVLPGQGVEDDDPFLQDFLFYVNRDGIMTFDTERQEFPPMVQVCTCLNCHQHYVYL